MTMYQQNSSKKFNLTTEIFTTKAIPNRTNVTNDILDLKLKCVTEGNVEDLNKWRHLLWSWLEGSQYIGAVSPSLHLLTAAPS